MSPKEIQSETERTLVVMILLTSVPVAGGAFHTGTCSRAPSESTNSTMTLHLHFTTMSLGRNAAREALNHM